MSEKKEPVKTEKRDSVTWVEEEHKAALARQKVLTESVNALPEFMQGVSDSLAKISDQLKTVPTQKDLDTIVGTKFSEYDAGLKKGLNEMFGKIDERFLKLEKGGGGGGDGFMGIIHKALNGELKVPGMGGATASPGYETEIALLEKDFMSRVRLEYRDWLAEKVGSLGKLPAAKMTEAATGGLAHP